MCSLSPMHFAAIGMRKLQKTENHERQKSQKSEGSAIIESLRIALWNRYSVHTHNFFPSSLKKNL